MFVFCELLTPVSSFSFFIENAEIVGVSSSLLISDDVFIGLFTLFVRVFDCALVINISSVFIIVWVFVVFLSSVISIVGVSVISTVGV